MKKGTKPTGLNFSMVSYCNKDFLWSLLSIVQFMYGERGRVYVNVKSHYLFTLFTTNYLLRTVNSFFGGEDLKI